MQQVEARFRTMRSLDEFAREDGDLFWSGEAVTLEQLPQLFSAEAIKQPKSELHIRAHRHVHYEKVAQVMALAAKAGLARIGFVSEPERM